MECSSWKSPHFCYIYVFTLSRCCWLAVVCMYLFILFSQMGMAGEWYLLAYLLHSSDARLDSFVLCQSCSSDKAFGMLKTDYWLVRINCLVCTAVSKLNQRNITDNMCLKTNYCDDTKMISMAIPETAFFYLR